MANKLSFLSKLNIHFLKEIKVVAKHFLPVIADKITFLLRCST